MLEVLTQRPYIQQYERKQEKIKHFSDVLETVLKVLQNNVLYLNAIFLLAVYQQ